MTNEVKTIEYMAAGLGGMSVVKLRSAAPANLVRPGQCWPNDAPRCYKCQHFKSNQALSGVCAQGVKRGLVTSHDTMRGDGCRSEYAPKWTKEEEKNSE